MSLVSNVSVLDPVTATKSSQRHPELNFFSISANYKGLVNPFINNKAFMSILPMLVSNWALDAERKSPVLSRGKTRAAPVFSEKATIIQALLER